MRLISSISAAMLVSAMSLGSHGKIGMAREYGETNRRFKLFELPKNNGPVVDTTKESKRAKRRRIAKGK